MSKYFFITFALVWFSPTLIFQDFFLKRFFIVWNVGQGQWASYVDKTTCHHFDMGGERNPLARVKTVCAEKENHLYISHWDWDHLSFVAKAHKVLKRICLKIPPLGKSSAYKIKLLASYKVCPPSSSKDFTLRQLTHFKTSILPKKTNELSHVLLAQDKYLIPGDSTKKQEKIWSREKKLARTKVLLLGHHGSKTSTSEELLARLPNLRTAIASARTARYGHPHFEVAERLKKHKVHLLKTEDWGNLWFQE